MEEARDLMKVALEEDITVENMSMHTDQDKEELVEWVFGSNNESISSNLEEDGYNSNWSVYALYTYGYNNTLILSL